MEISEEWCPPGIAIDTVAIDHFCDTGIGIECILSTFVSDISLCGVVDILKGGNALKRDLERWAHVHPTKFSKAKCMVQHLVQGDLKH